MATATRNRDRASAGSAFGLLGGRPPSLHAAVTFALVCAAAVVALRLWLKWGGTFPGDQWVLNNHGEAWRQPTALVDLNSFFSVIGTPAVALLTVALALPFAMRAEGARGAAFVILATAGVLVNAGLKELSGPTPVMLELGGGSTSGLNFPSGHVAYAVVTFGALAVLARRAGRTDLVIPAVVLILLMGPFRVTATAHFASDVVAGYLVGAAWLVLSAALVLGDGAPKRARRR